ncbi:MAG: GIY-YIG nuclease family protein [Anaerolineaceae bacterium]|nr:GIY-YIG nuclease family protein [Anaerolineaceae bacterium]
MTRRLEPMDRIDELGDASVPFSFDVHALIFSENAPELETKLHQRFHSTRLNKLNSRKEFFRADINEIEKVIKENYDKVVDILKEAPAEQFRESLKLS